MAGRQSGGSVRVTVRGGGRGAEVEGALMCMQAGGYLSGTAKEALLAHGHGVGMGAGKFSPWPCEMGDCSDVAMDKSIRQPVSAQWHSRVVGGGHVHVSLHGGEGAGYVISKGLARDIGLLYLRLQIG